MRRFWVDTNSAATLPSDKISTENFQLGSSYSERIAKCLTKLQWHSVKSMLFPSSLNAIREELDTSKTQDDPQNMAVYSSLLTT